MKQLYSQEATWDFGWDDWELRVGTTQEEMDRGVPGGLVVRILGFHCGGFNPWSGN